MQAIGPDVASLSDLVHQLARRFDEQPAFGHLGARISFADLDRLSRRFAAWVQHETDLKPGDRIVLQLPNIMQYPVVLFGARRAGLVVVNANPLYSCEEMCQQLRDSGARAIVAFAPVPVELTQCLASTAVEYLVTTELGDLHPPLRRCGLNLLARLKRRGMRPVLLSTRRAAGVRQIALTAVMQKGSKLIWQPSESTGIEASLALLQYTGGTTGPAKGAMLTEAALLANLTQLQALISQYCVPGQERLLQPLPLYHIYSFTLTLLMLSLGAYIELVPDPRRVRGLVRCWDRLDPTVLAGINPLFVNLCRQPEFQRLDFSSLKLTVSGGMSLTRAVAARWHAVTGKDICEGYGLTECSPVVSVNCPDAIRLGTVGKPLVQTDVHIVDDCGHVLPPGESGNIRIRGPQLMSGYWHQRHETETVLQDGWLDTGDIGLIDHDGYLRVIDRRKEVINVSGFKVYPSELEDVIACHPDIVECAVVGLPDSNRGEQIKLYVVPANQQLSIREVREYCRERLTAYKVPRSVEFCQRLPRTAIGKVSRRDLRDRALQGQRVH
ncbi:MAG: AMP-binding protein [Oceanospirillales bacterium]|uniref:Long-chain-fatty-acid--CoA ligase n=1 Tax=Marinobacterium halophilum TaxID=267374 RepID=A0A2P8EUW6_9GAMM|nr:AMP-binding protein [Marinobacterium halophilum]MBR9827358.1 AMP-binding protein [Oceanospirillales bacterium]PSL13269.1 long-chain acyl-CoA synthetase [Marinobacterium halophilum]